MSARPSAPSHFSLPPRTPWRLANPLAVCVFAIAGLAGRVEAGPSEPTRRHPMVEVTPAPEPVLEINTWPHLVAIGPRPLSVQPIPGPYRRRPPALPQPTPVTKAPEPTASPAPEAAGASSPTPPSAAPTAPSVLSPDAPITLLPVPQPKPTPTPAPIEEPKENVLVPTANGAPELKDAVIYFEAPNGSRVNIFTPASSNALVPATTAPESHATYQQKESE